jgi:cytochrome P450
MYDLGDPEAPAAVVAATNEVRAFLEEVVEERRRRPGDDLISALVRSAEEDGPLETDECVMLAIEVIQGGTKTTAAQLGHMMRLFTEHPEQWRLLGSRPDLAEKATEEVLRFEPIVPFDPRTIPSQREISGVTFPSGSLVFACIATANRDPVLFPDPDRFDITADRTEESFAFGLGRRYCLGASLARAEIQETLAFLPSRMLDLRLEGEAEFGSPTAGIYAMKAVPLSFTV